MSLDTKFILDAISKFFDKFDARWAKRNTAREASTRVGRGRKEAPRPGASTSGRVRAAGTSREDGGEGAGMDSRGSLLHLKPEGDVPSVAAELRCSAGGSWGL
jgi:hypothetical protein